MKQLKRMAVFAEVVAAGSMTAAARRLRMTPSAVSQQLRQLEHGLGLTLLHRTTRRLSLTEAGERFHEGCSAMVAAARAAEQALTRLRDEPEGELRLAAPVALGGDLARALAPLRVHPRLRLQLLLNDNLIDLVEARVDIALRVGHLPDSSLVARRLAHVGRQLCAAPRYLNERGWPAAPADLAQHDWLGGRPGDGEAQTLTLLGPDDQPVSVALSARVQVSSVSALHALCVEGWGVGVAVSPDDHRALAEGRLLPLLPGWRLQDLPLWAVTPRRGEQAAKVRHALDLLSAHFAGLPKQAGG